MAARHPRPRPAPAHGLHPDGPSSQQRQLGQAGARQAGLGGAEGVADLKVGAQVGVSAEGCRHLDPGQVFVV